MPAKTGPYSRQYWRFIDEYPLIYEHDAAYALWSRLLITGDMAWPASGSLPLSTRPKALAMLTDAGLVQVLPAGRFRIPSMDKERQARSDAGKYAISHRWPTDSNTASGNTTRNTEGIPSRAKPRKEEPSQAGVRLSDEEQRGQLDKLADVLEANGALPAKRPNGEQRPYRTDTDEAVVKRARAILADESQPEWRRKAARDQLEVMGL